MASFNYIKSLALKNGGQYTLALGSDGTLWTENVLTAPFIMTPLEPGEVPGSYMFSTTQDDVEYMCFSDLRNGTDIPRQYNPQPAVSDTGYTLDRISQVGPGAPPRFQPTVAVTANQVTITSWAGSGTNVIFQAVNTFAAGDLVNLSGFAVSTFFNGKTVQVLGTALTGAQFQVSFPNYTGGTDHGFGTPQYGYPIQGITQPASVGFFGQIALWSAGPGSTSSGNTITLYYRPGGSFNQDPTLVNQFNSGVPVYVYISNAPFGNGVSLITSIGKGKPPGESGLVPYFTIPATTSNFQKVGSASTQGNNGRWQISLATITVQIPIPSLSIGDEITITGASPGSWNATWTVSQTLNSGVYAITQTVMSGGTATYSWNWAGTAVAATPPAVGQLVTVIQTLNGNGVFNVTDAKITGVTGTASSGTFSISGFQSQDVAAEPETGQAQTAGTSFQFDPGQTLLGTQTTPIFGNAAANTGIVTITGSNNAIGPGTRQAVVFFETREGLKTACSSPVTFTTDITATYILAESVPVGPPNVIRRWIAFTGAGPNGIPGPNFYTINQPVTYTINDQTYRYTATFIDDNVTTSAKFTFTDAILLAGEEIDVQGNNLFNQIELGSSAWNVAYADRMFYGLEQNKILNFTNLSFDGGYIPSTGNLTPLGWGLDPASNIDSGDATTITSFSISSNIVTIVTSNTFIVGQNVLIDGLAVGTYLNGQTVSILTVSGSQFTAAFTHADVGSTPDTGTATPVSSSGTLIESDVFGDSFYIQNQTGVLQPTLGMIVQSAALDAYNVPILNNNTLYSVRITARIPSGMTVGNLVVDLTDSNPGFVSGSGTMSGYGTTFGSFILPFTSLTENLLIYTGALLTVPFTTGVPPGLLLRVYAQNIGYGADVEVDRLEIFETKLPVLTTNIRVSYALNFEAFDGITGNIGLAEHNQQSCYGAVELHDQLYFLQSASMQSTQDVPGTEPSGPGGGWSVHEVSNRVGTCGIHAYDYGEEWILTACRNGLFGFNGGQPMRLDFQQKEVWESINWAYGHTIWLSNDLQNRRILVGVPLPTPNRWLPLAPVNLNPVSPNVMLMWNYQGLNDFNALIGGEAMHETMFGNLVATDLRLKMSIWQIASPFAGLITQPDLSTLKLTVCNGLDNDKIYQLDPDALSDDGAAVNGVYFTYGFTSSDKAAEFPLLGLHRKRFTLTQQLVTGSGVCTITAYPNFIYTPSTLAFNSQATSTTINLVESPSDDITRPWNVGGNRVFWEFQTNAVEAAMNLSKLIAVGTADPFASTNPNAG